MKNLKFNKISILIVLLVTITQLSIAQNVGIGTTTPDASAMLDIQSTDKGILIPRTDTATVNSASGTLATSLMIFQTTDNKFYYFDGSKWIKITTPKDAVFERNGSTIRQTGNYNDDFIIGHDTVPANGVSTTKNLLFYDNSKYAFRSGKLHNSTNWSPDSIGYGSFAFGYNTKAKGDYSTAWGAVTDATGKYSTAWGNGTKAPSGYETALGHYNTTYTPIDSFGWNNLDRLFSIGDGASNYNRHNALTIMKNGDFIIGYGKVPENGVSTYKNLLFYNKSKYAFRSGKLHNSKNWSPDSIGYGSFAFGYNTKAKGDYSTAWGNATDAIGDYSTAWGFETDAIGDYSTAWGNATNAIGDYSTAWGSVTNATGKYSTAWGNRTKAPSGYETVLGRYNTIYTPIDTFGWNNSDRLFSIGNGINTYNRRNALTIMKNGDFILGYDKVPENGVSTYKDLLFYDKSKYAFRSGKLHNSKNWSPDSIGIGSFAFGYNTKAKGDYSTAWGIRTKATGYASTTWGNTSGASGDYSTAWGQETDASGHYSSAWGRGTKAPSGYETALGRYNTIYTPTSITDWNDSDRLFSIGDGTGYNDCHNALTIMKNGDFIIGHDKVPENGVSTYKDLLFYDKSKYAFRSGKLENSKNWSPDSIGYGSFAFGKNTKAKGNFSTAWGISTEATGDFSTAWGHETDATGGYSTAWGNASDATGDYSIAWGYNTDATGYASTTWGNSSDATGSYSTAWGHETDASGHYSTAWGRGTKAPSGYETALGRYNTIYTPTSTTDWNDSDRLFSIGNGTSSSNRNDALTIMKNGNIGIDMDNPTAKLDINGSIKISGGNPGVGKVLTSDADGLASWGSAGVSALNDLSDAYTDGSNIFVGAQVGTNDNGGNFNTVFGDEAFKHNISGDHNTGFGYKTLENSTGNYNTAFGLNGLRQNTSGSDNVALGSGTLYENQTGSDNVAIGKDAGYGATGTSISGCIFLGNEAGKNNTASNKLFIDNSDTTTPLIGGDFSSDELYFNTTKLGIGTDSPNEILEVAGETDSYGRMLVSDGGGASRKGLLFTSPDATHDYSRIDAYDYGSAAGKTLRINTVGNSNVVFGGNVLPESHKGSDLGANGTAWDDIYYDDLHNQGAAAFTDRKVSEEILLYPPIAKKDGDFDVKTDKGLYELDPKSMPDALHGENSLLTDEISTYNYKANYEQQLQIEELKAENAKLKARLDKLEKLLTK